MTAFAVVFCRCLPDDMMLALKGFARQHQRGGLSNHKGLEPQQGGLRKRWDMGPCLARTMVFEIEMLRPHKGLS